MVGMVRFGDSAKLAYVKSDGTQKRDSVKKRFAPGAQVEIVNPGIVGTVLKVGDAPTIMGEYWHIIQTEFGEQEEPGSNLELVPAPQTNQPPPPVINAAASQEQADREFARLAIDEAQKSAPEDGRVHPRVGVVIVKDGKVLASAHRGEIPQCHAEYIALEKKLADVSLSGATVYTTLEPCTARNHPKVPCAIRLTERRVGRVVIGMLDPDDRIRGRGQLALRKARIAIGVFPNDLVAEVEELNRDFIRDREFHEKEVHQPLPHFYRFDGKPGPIPLNGIQHSAQGPWMDLWGLVTIVNPTMAHMKIGLHRLVLGGQECAVVNFFFRPKSDRLQRYERISLMGNAKEDYEVHAMFSDSDYPTPPSREGELWVSVDGHDGIFPVKITCP